MSMNDWTPAEREARWTNQDATVATLTRDVRLHAMLDSQRPVAYRNIAWEMLDMLSDRDLWYVVNPDMTTEEAIAEMEAHIRRTF